MNPVDAPFLVLAVTTLVAAVAAMSLRNLIHCALCLVVVFFSVAGLFLLLGAEFIAFAQVMVYVGAIAILIVFATLLTGNTGVTTEALSVKPKALGLGLAGVVSGALIAALLASPGLPEMAGGQARVSVRRLGEELMSGYVLPLEVIGLLLTAALIGGALLALGGSGAGGPDGKDPRA